VTDVSNPRPRRLDPRVGALAIIAMLAVVSVVAIALLPGGTAPAPSASPSPSSPPPASPSPPPASGVTTVGPTYDTSAARTPTAGGGRRVWYAQGTWWAVLISAPSQSQHIFRLDPVGGAWQDTGMIVDARPDAEVDTVARGDGLYVLSAGSGQRASDAPTFTAFSFDPAIGRYRAAPNMPVVLGTGGVGSLSLAVDPTGTAWVSTLAGGRLLVRRSVQDLIHWSAPVAPTGADPGLGPADVARVVATSDRVAVTWTDVQQGVVLLSWAADASSPSTTWDPPETAGRFALPTRPFLSAVAGDGGRVFVAVTRDGVAADPAVSVLARSPDGSWRDAVAALGRDHATTPVLTTIEPGGDLIVAMTAPSGGGTVWYKRTSQADPRFEGGAGTTLIADPAGPSVADPSAPGQPVDAESGLLVLAADRSVGQYLTGTLSLAATGSGPTPTPSALPSLAPVPRTLADDRFASYTSGDPVPATWSLDVPERGHLGLVAEKDGTVGRVSTTTAAKAVRACRSIAGSDTSVLSIVLVARVQALGRADAPVLLVRGPGFGALDVRIEGTTFSYFDGAKKIQTKVPARLGRWYAFQATVQPDGRSDLTIRADGPKGSPVLNVKGIAPRQAPTSAIDRVCTETSSGRSGLAIDLQSLQVQATDR
jgi:hypothetical protein